jgi:hypothetical protein
MLNCQVLDVSKNRLPTATTPALSKLLKLRVLYTKVGKLGSLSIRLGYVNARIPASWKAGEIVLRLSCSEIYCIVEQMSLLDLQYFAAERI